MSLYKGTTFRLCLSVVQYFVPTWGFFFFHVEICESLRGGLEIRGDKLV